VFDPFSFHLLNRQSIACFDVGLALADDRDLFPRQLQTAGSGFVVQVELHCVTDKAFDTYAGGFGGALSLEVKRVGKENAMHSCLCGRSEPILAFPPGLVVPKIIGNVSARDGAGHTTTILRRF
jgi:hypothetical protein